MAQITIMQTTLQQQIEAIQSALQIKRRNIEMSKRSVELDPEFCALNDAGSTIAAIRLNQSLKQFTIAELSLLRREIAQLLVETIHCSGLSAHSAAYEVIENILLKNKYIEQKSSAG